MEMKMAKLAKYEVKGMVGSMCKKMSQIVKLSQKYYYKFPDLINQEIAKLDGIRDAAITAAVWTNCSDTVLKGIRSHHSNCTHELNLLLQSFPEKY